MTIELYHNYFDDIAASIWLIRACLWCCVHICGSKISTKTGKSTEPHWGWASKLNQESKEKARNQHFIEQDVGITNLDIRRVVEDFFRGGEGRTLVKLAAGSTTLDALPCRIVSFAPEPNAITASALPLLCLGLPLPLPLPLPHPHPLSFLWLLVCAWHHCHGTTPAQSHGWRLFAAPLNVSKRMTVNKRNDTMPFFQVETTPLCLFSFLFFSFFFLFNYYYYSEKR